MTSHQENHFSRLQPSSQDGKIVYNPSMSEASTQEQSLILCKGKTEAANAGNLTNDLKVSGEHPERQKVR